MGALATVLHLAWVACGVTGVVLFTLIAVGWVAWWCWYRQPKRTTWRDGQRDRPRRRLWPRLPLFLVRWRGARRHRKHAWTLAPDAPRPLTNWERQLWAPFEDGD